MRNPVYIAFNWFWVSRHPRGPIDWTKGKDVFLLIATALSGMGAIHLITLGVIGELVVSTSDLSHTQLPETTKKKITISDDTR